VCQPFADQDVADVAAIDRQRAAEPPVIAPPRALGVGRTSR
jgi:hypothetical protein